MNNKVITMKISDELLNKLKQEANKQQIGYTTLIKIILNKYFKGE